MVNPFSATGFDVITMTQAINRVPDVERYIGQVERLGVFRPLPISTTVFSLEEHADTLNLLASKPRGGVAPKNTTARRKMRDFSVPHYPLEDLIKSEEVQGVRAFGTENNVETIANVMAKKLAHLRRKHELTKEFQRMQCLKGIVLDGDGTTLLNLFDALGQTQQTVSFELDNSATDVNLKCRDVIQRVEDASLGEVFTEIICLCSRGFYNTFVGHANVKEAFKYFQTTQQLSGDFSKGFNFGGITFIPFNANTTRPDGTAQKFIADNYAHFIPLGTQNTFVEVYAPADFLETANTLGLPFYAKQEPMKFNRGIEVHTQMNYLPFCARPEMLIQGKRQNSD